MSPPSSSSSTAAASSTAMLLSVLGITAFSDTLADFLYQWNSVVLYAASITAALPLPALPPASPAGSAHDPSPDPDPLAAEPDLGGDPVADTMGLICKEMGSRALHHFVAARLGDRPWLVRVGPGALRRAADPAELALRAVGRYYIRPESRRAEAACDLILELYVRAGCPLRQGQEGAWEAEPRAEEAREAALSWRCRIVREKGRVADANAKDARGLILFMAAFGVPAEFPALELYDLLHAGGGLACTDVLKCSQSFVKKLHDVVPDLLSKGNYHEAIAIITAFELQDTFPLATIMTYIMERIGRRKDQEVEGQVSLVTSKERNEQELVQLESLSKYVEDHKLCSLEFSCFIMAERDALLEEGLGMPNEAFTGEKRKRTAEEDSLECTRRSKCPCAPASSSESINSSHAA